MHRQLSSGSSKTIDPQKMQAKSLVISQWKLLNQLKDYISKFSADKAFENALNKEFAHFLQKIQPSVYGNDLIRYFESITLQIDNKNVDKNKIRNEQNTTTYFPNVLNGIKIKIGGNSEGKKLVPKWKEAQLAVLKESVASRTQHLVSLLVETQSDNSILTNIEDLIAHIEKYPEAKHIAVKVLNQMLL